MAAAIRKRLYLCRRYLCGDAKDKGLMRKWALLLLLWGVAWPAMAAKSLSVDQIEQLLFKLQDKPDGKVAGELQDAQLTERVTGARLAHWKTEFPGKRSQEELMRLADMSAFLRPPASDVLRDPAPDKETQERMLSMAVEYVRATTTRLPEFYATRETTHFEDTLSSRADFQFPGSMAKDEHSSLGGLPVQTNGMSTTTEYRTLHSTGEYSETVTYRDGQEVLDEGSGNQKKAEEPALGLTSNGEFGPILAAVIDDVIPNGVSWLRWEQGNGEPAGVFYYDVPTSPSHFRIRITVNGKEQALFPAYHGELEIDPATGEILRLSEVADFMPPSAGMQAAIMVEYAPVTIGDQSYICPVRGVAYSRFPIQSGSTADDVERPGLTELNDLAFTQFHQFRSDARIVANAGGNGGSNGGGQSGASQPEAAAGAAADRAPAPTSTAPPSAQAQGTEPAAVTAASALGAPPSTQIVFQARVLPEGDPALKGPDPDSGPAGDKSASLKGGAHRYIVDLSVNPQGLTFAEGADGAQRTQLECALVVYDGEGNRVNSLGRSFDFHLTAEQYQQLRAKGGVVPARLAIDLPSGEVVLRIVAYEPASARIGSLEIPVIVADK